MTTPMEEHPSFPSKSVTGGDKDLQDLVQNMVGEIFKFLDDERRGDKNPPAFSNSPTSNNAVNFLHPSELEDLLTPLQIQYQGATHEEILSDVRFVLGHAVKTGHQRCLNQLFHRADIISIVGDWIATALNTNIYTYEMAPVTTLLELDLVERYGKLIGWEHCDGTFPPGGSIANLFGICMARTSKFPTVIAEGWHPEDQPVMFGSVDAHYSLKKSAAMIGMGWNNLIGVATDKEDRMCPEELEKAVLAQIAKGKKPFLVVGTIGTTLTGAIDPIRGLSRVAKKYGMWFHVDAALGGSLMHSSRMRKTALDGLEEADSLTINPHKMMGMTLQCSAIFTRHPHMLANTFSSNAAYLFNDDKQYDASRYDVGDKTFQCGRKNDCLKLWLTWRFRGDEGMDKYIEDGDERHQRFNAILAKRSNEYVRLLQVAGAVPCTCFWYIPKKFVAKYNNDAEAIRAALEQKDTDLYRCLDRMASRVKQRLMERSYAVLTCSRLQNYANFWRLVTNGAVEWSTDEFVDFLDTLASTCEEVVRELDGAEHGKREVTEV